MANIHVCAKVCIVYKLCQDAGHGNKETFEDLLSGPDLNKHVDRMLLALNKMCINS